METISIGLDDPLLIKLLPSILIIIGFAITIWRIRAEANSNKALIEKQNKWERTEKLRNQQEKYFENFMDLMENITKDQVIGVDSFTKLKSFTIKAIRLFDDDAVVDPLDIAVKLIENHSLDKKTVGTLQSQEVKEATIKLNNALGSHLALVIEYLKKKVV